jgi:hypothetical protein
MEKMMADTNPKAHLGVGWGFPVKPVNGGLVYVRYEADIEQAIPIILLTEPGERPMLPEFGAGLRRYVFEPSSAATYRAIEQSVEQALIDWEPRIDIDSVTVTPDEDEPNLLLIAVDFVVRATDTSYNRVYPFYLLQGGD